MHSKQRTVLTLPMLTLLVGGSVAIANPSNPAHFAFETPQKEWLAQSPRPSERSERGPARLMQQLNLSNAQMQQLATIRQKYQQQMMELKQQLQTNRNQLRQMMTGTESAAAIRDKHQQMSNLRQQMESLRFESMLEMRNVLTPQQRQEFAQLMEQHRQQFRHRRGDRFEEDVEQP